MVHALERARRHLHSGGVLVCIQPRRGKRPFIAVKESGQRRPVGALVNPVFEPLISAAEAAIQAVVEAGLFVKLGAGFHQFRIRVDSLAELDRYLHLGARPPRFPAGARQRLESLWRSRSPGAQIEVTEYLAVIALSAP